MSGRYVMETMYGAYPYGTWIYSIQSDDLDDILPRYDEFSRSSGVRIIDTESGEVIRCNIEQEDDNE